MIGSFGGEGGEFFLVFLFGRKEDHLNWSMKMKAKMVKTKVWSNMGVTFGTKNCRKFDIFISLFQASVCRFWMFKVCRVSLLDVPQIFNFHIYIYQTALDTHVMPNCHKNSMYMNVNIVSKWLMI